MPTCECRRFTCVAVEEFFNGEIKPSQTSRIRLHKNEISGRIDGSDIVESGIVTCEIKEAGQFAGKDVVRHMGELSLKKITKSFMIDKGMEYGED